MFYFISNSCSVTHFHVTVLVHLWNSGKAWQIQLLVVLMKIPSFPAQLFLPPSVIEPLNDPFIDEFEFGGVDQESEDEEASLPYPAETFEDHRLVSSPSLQSMPVSNLSYSWFLIHGSLSFLLLSPIAGQCWVSSTPPPSSPFSLELSH